MITKQMILKWILHATLDRDRASKATAKHHKHIVGESFKPSKIKAAKSPAAYRRKQIKATRAAKQKRKEIRLHQKLTKKEQDQ